MANEVSELVVAARPEGIDETTDQLGEMREDFEETADEMGDTTEQFEDLSSKWTGLMGTLVGGIAIMGASLLGQIPILSAAASAIGAVFSAIGLQVDQLLRDLGAEGFVGAIFTAANAIAGLEGIVGDVAAVLSIFAGSVAAAAARAGILAAISSGSLTAGLSAAGGVLTTVGSAIATVVGGLTSLISLPVAAAIGLILIALTDFMGLRTKFIKFVTSLGEGFANLAGKAANAAGDIAAGVADAFTDLVDDALSFGQRVAINIGNGIINMVEGAVGAAAALARRVGDAVEDVVDSASEYGRDFVENFVDGVMSRVDWAQGKMEDAFNYVTPDWKFDLPENDRMAQRFGSDFVQEWSGGARQAAQEADVPLPTDMDAGGGFRARREKQPTIIMDGRELTKQDGRFRDDTTSRRNSF